MFDRFALPRRGRATLLTVALVAALFLTLPEVSIDLLARLSHGVIDRFGLLFVVIASLAVLLCTVLCLSPYGRLRLGGADTQPEFGFASWVAMLFTAGMGSGLIFWGVAEPVFHLANPPAFAAGDPAPADTALALTYFHWGLHAWSLYAIAGLAIAWFSYNRGRAMLISASFTERADPGPWGVLNLLAVMAIVFGVAGTFANTIALVQTGLQQTLSPQLGGPLLRVALLLAIAVLFTGSSMLGLQRGIKRLSNFNAALMLGLLMLVVLAVSPSQSLSALVSSTGRYLTLLPEVAFDIDPASYDWSLGWTVIYLVWWVAWTPFVGPFIARISRGRTIRQFLLCTVLLPTLASILWFSGFAGSLFQQPYLPEVMAAVNQDYTQGLFRFLAELPLGTLLSLAALLLLITFIVTSADSAIYVSTMLTRNDDPGSKLLWSALMVALAIALVLINDVDLNKQIAIAGALPYTLVLVAQVGAFLRDLVRHPRP
nr:BCCT family transporter [Ferrimonas balearica]